LGKSDQGSQRSDAVDKSKRTETREFWEEAVRLWNESGLSVRDFCAREGLTEHTFYSRRREVLPENTTSEVDHESPAASGDETPTVRRRQRSRKRVIADDAMDATITSPFVELVASQLQQATPGGLCRYTLELENADGAKMRIQLRSVAMPDVAAITQGFWNHSS
jgi:transposase-like protein